MPTAGRVGPGETFLTRRLHTRLLDLLVKRGSAGTNTDKMRDKVAGICIWLGVWVCGCAKRKPVIGMT